MNTFEELNLNQSLRKALNDLGYTVPTSIQSKAFSVVMSGSDVIGIAQTGTGKTLAYLLPCLRLWNFTKDIHPQILIIVPTRELVAQVEQEIQKLSTYMTIRICGVYGGTNIKNQAKIIQEGIDIIVGTPGRLLDLVLNGHLKLKSIKRLIIDEVDEMLDLGFRPQLIRVFDLLPKKRQNLMFSATLTYDVEQLILTYFSNTIKIEAAPSGTPLEKIILQGYKVPNFNTKINVLAYLLKKEEFKKTLIFTRTKALADQVFEKLNLLFPNQIGIIHSNKEQNYRFKSVEDFKQGITIALIATDIIARGIDIEGVSHVINFDIPDLPELYIHRIGRTGRADKDGIAISFITEKDEPLHDEIETFIQKAVSIVPLPEDIKISDILTDDELPNTGTREIQIKRPKIDLTSSAFHEKSDKNKKTNHKIRRNEKMMKKYGKPITRGQKKKEILMINQEQTIINQTINWIKQVVIGCNFCPFAAKALSIKNNIRYNVVFANNNVSIDELILSELKYLSEHEDIETSFTLFPDSYESFEDFLDLVEESEIILEEEGYEGIIQIASFHPQYCFEGSHDEDPANYTNRSIYPMLHFLREESIEKIRLHYDDLESIPQRNIQYAQEKGLNYMTLLRASCIQQS